MSDKRAPGLAGRKEIRVLVPALSLAVCTTLIPPFPPGLQFPTFKMSNLDVFLWTFLLMKYHPASLTSARSQKHAVDRESGRTRVPSLVHMKDVCWILTLSFLSP